MELSGHFALLSLAGLLQALCQEERSVSIHAWTDSEHATIEIVGGLITGARCIALADFEAIAYVLSWQDGMFGVSLLAADAVCGEPIGSWETVLLEAARRRDEREVLR